MLIIEVIRRFGLLIVGIAATVVGLIAFLSPQANSTIGGVILAIGVIALIIWGLRASRRSGSGSDAPE
ncbi:MAG TPA: hypothetical protein VGP24_03665 [Glaciihabitans sp.]|jgi:membrane protein implicated in regulation of membrane protease activity|nr:hypothetical protein [Glaciihabitans sp.]